MPNNIEDAVNWWQKSGSFHPLTCKDEHGSESRDLVPKPLEDGTTVLVCPTCGYTQSWIPGVVQEAYEHREEMDALRDSLFKKR